MTVSEFIEWLKTKDQDAEVHVACSKTSGYETYVKFKKFNSYEHSYWYKIENILELGGD